MKIDFKSISIADEYGELHSISRQNLESLLVNIYKSLRHAESVASECSFENPGPQGYFCLKNEVFIKLTEDKAGDNDLIEADDTFYVRKRDGAAELIARESGYPVLENGVMTIYSPCKITADKVHLFYIFYPVKSGRDNLKDDFFSALSMPSKEHGVRMYSAEDIFQRVDSGKIHILTISMGIPAVPARKEQLNLKVSGVKKAESTPDGGIDNYSFSIFREVKEGTVLAEKINGIEGQAGIDAYGNEIPVVAWKEIPFSAGKNVRTEEIPEDGRIEYIADITGVLELKATSVSVLEVLHVAGDVCAETGSIDFSRDVIVDGDVHSLFRIKCGGNLTVKGFIENGASIICAGDFHAEKGIIGEKTELVVNGNMETEFISDAGIRIKGDLLVHGTIYSSEVFCGGTLVVEGKKLKNRQRGSVIGSSATAMKGLTVHSAGSRMSKTSLICGIDRKLKEELDKMRESVPVFNKKILGLQNRIGIDLTRSDLIEKLKHLPLPRRQEIKAILEDIKIYAEQKAGLEERIVKLQPRVLNRDTGSLKIKINSHLIPDTEILIGELHVMIEKEYGPLEVFVQEDEIKFRT